MHTAIFLPEKHCNIDLFFLPCSPSSVLREAAAQETGAVAPLLCAAFMAQPSRPPLFGDGWNFGLCVWQSFYLYQVFHLNFLASVFHWRIYDFLAFLDSASLLLFLFIRISDLWERKILKNKTQFLQHLSIWKAPSSGKGRHFTTLALYNFLPHELTSGL